MAGSSEQRVTRETTRAQKMERIRLMQTATALAHALLPSPKIADVDACYDALYRVESCAAGLATLRQNELEIRLIDRDRELEKLRDEMERGGVEAEADFAAMAAIKNDFRRFVRWVPQEHYDHDPDGVEMIEFVNIPEMARAVHLMKAYFK